MELFKSVLRTIFISITSLRPKRSSVSLKLKNSFPQIREYLLNLFNEITNGGEKLTNQSLNNSGLMQDHKTGFFLLEIGIKCLNSWTDFGIPFNDIQPFVEFLFYAIYNDSLFETSAECLTTIFSSEENLKFTNTLFKYTPKVLALSTVLNTFVENRDNVC